MKKPEYLSIPKQIDLFGRTIKTTYDSKALSYLRVLGQAKYGVNQIALSKLINEDNITEEELKLTYIHEMLHFILNFTGYEAAIIKNEKIDLEQFVELMASGIFQYEKTAKY